MHGASNCSQLWLNHSSSSVFFAIALLRGNPTSDTEPFHIHCFKEMLAVSRLATIMISMVPLLVSVTWSAEISESQHESFRTSCTVEDGSVSLLQRRAHHAKPAEYYYKEREHQSAHRGHSGLEEHHYQADERYSRLADQHSKHGEHRLAHRQHHHGLEERHSEPDESYSRFADHHSKHGEHHSMHRNVHSGLEEYSQPDERYSRLADHHSESGEHRVTHRQHHSRREQPHSDPDESYSRSAEQHSKHEHPDHRSKHGRHHSHRNGHSNNGTGTSQHHWAADEIAEGVFSAASVSAGSAAVLTGLAPPGLSFTELAAHEIEFELGAGANRDKLPRKSKLTLALLESFFLPAMLGVDRCYLGQPCIGVIKGITLGGFGIWYFIDYLIIAYNSLMKEEYVNVFGLNAWFGPSELQSAFYCTVFFLLLKLILMVFGGRWGGKQVPGDQPLAAPVFRSPNQQIPVHNLTSNQSGNGQQ